MSEVIKCSLPTCRFSLSACADYIVVSMLMLRGDVETPAVGNFYFSPVRLEPVFKSAYAPDSQQKSRKARSKPSFELAYAPDSQPRSRKARSKPDFKPVPALDSQSRSRKARSKPNPNLDLELDVRPKTKHTDEIDVNSGDNISDDNNSPRKKLFLEHCSLPSRRMLNFFQFFLYMHNL